MAVPTETVAALIDILRCPATQERLEIQVDSLTTSAGYRYPLVDGIPVLVAAGQSLFGAETVSPAPQETRSRRLRARVRRVLTAPAVSSQNLRRLGELLESYEGDSERRRVLVVGGGILGFGVEELVKRDWIDLVETDVYIGPRTKVVCDAHDLPFTDASFHAVVVQAVLEHVVDPTRVVAELHRVLKRDGLIYSEIPFMQQVHEGAYDFTRFTLGGHRRLLRNFAEIDSGAVGGPGEALAWSLRYFVAALSGESARISRIAGMAVFALTLPLRWSDALTRGRPASVDAASGTYLLGRRRPTPRTDADIVAAYLGQNQIAR